MQMNMTVDAEIEHLAEVAYAGLSPNTFHTERNHYMQPGPEEEEVAMLSMLPE